MRTEGMCVAVVGPRGIAGQTLLTVLEQRAFPVRELRALGSGRSAGATVRFRGELLEVVRCNAEAFDGVDLAFLATESELSRALAPEAARRGATVIDKSSAWRLEPDVPLVVPEVNGATAQGHRGLLASPNCTTTALVMALEPLRRLAGLRSVVVTTMQAASGAGRAGMAELAAQLADAAAPARVFARPLAGDVVPQCAGFLEDGETVEERKLRDETRKILGLPSLPVTATCVRVPVLVGHSAAILVETERPITPDAARAALAAFPGVRVVDAPGPGTYPVTRDVVGGDDVLVGRIRRDLANPHRLWLWQVSDNLRKGAALNAVQIAELIRR